MSEPDPYWRRVRSEARRRAWSSVKSASNRTIFTTGAGALIALGRVYLQTADLSVLSGVLWSAAGAGGGILASGVVEYLRARSQVSEEWDREKEQELAALKLRLESDSPHLRLTHWSSQRLQMNFPGFTGKIRLLQIFVTNTHGATAKRIVPRFDFWDATGQRIGKEVGRWSHSPHPDPTGEDGPKPTDTQLLSLEIPPNNYPEKLDLLVFLPSEGVARAYTNLMLAGLRGAQRPGKSLSFSAGSYRVRLRLFAENYTKDWWFIVSVSDDYAFHVSDIGELPLVTGTVEAE